MMPRTSLVYLIFAFALLMMAMGCGGGGGGSESLVASITGVVYAPDGITPVPDALVYVPSGRAPELPEAAITWTTSAADGSFTLNNVPVGMAVIKIVKDEWNRSLEVNVSNDNSMSLPAATTTLCAGGDNQDGPPGAPFDPDDSDDPIDAPPGSPFGD